MREILEQLTAQTGVRLAALVMEDGVPVAVCGNREALGDHEPSSGHGKLVPRDAEALAALSASWVLEVCAAVAPLAWERPLRLALRGAQGTLVLRRAHTAWLLVLLKSGMRIEDVVLLMDGSAARLERYVRELGLEQQAAAARHLTSTPAALPAAGIQSEERGEARASSDTSDQELPKGR